MPSNIELYRNLSIEYTLGLIINFMSLSPHFRGHLINNSTTLGHRMVSLLQRFLQFGGL